ncbi:MAG: GNAT family N-acetyltransferase [Candidatus Hodarchaeota archaeon]
MVKIRKGLMKDCKDLLEVYMGTRWTEDFTTVEQVKHEHRGVAFRNWGWLVAQERKKVVGEILFRIEKNPAAGRIGIIRSLGVDVRFQKRGFATKLTRAAEKVMKSRKVGRIVCTTTPEAYNYWMKVDYHKRYWVMEITSPVSKIPASKSKKVSTRILEGVKHLPTSMKFSNIAYPGLLAETVREIVILGRPGLMFEYLSGDSIVGVGAVVVGEDKTARFVADVVKGTDNIAEIIIKRTARAAAKLKAKTVSSLIPQEKLPWYMEMTKWSSEMHRNFPVTKLI